MMQTSSPSPRIFRRVYYNVSLDYDYIYLLLCYTNKQERPITDWDRLSRTPLYRRRYRTRPQLPLPQPACLYRTTPPLRASSKKLGCNKYVNSLSPSDMILRVYTQVNYCSLIYTPPLQTHDSNPNINTEIIIQQASYLQFRKHANTTPPKEKFNLTLGIFFFIFEGGGGLFKIIYCIPQPDELLTI